MQKQIKERSEKVKIATPYGTIESDSGNHYLDIATIVIILIVCALLKSQIVMAVKKFLKKK